MATDIARLVVSLEAESAKMRSELTKANKSLDKFGKKANTITSRAKAAFAGLGGALVGGAIVYGLKNMVGNTLEVADALAKTSDAIGVSTDLLQELNFAAERSGVSTEQLAGNMTAFVKRVGEAKSATGPLVSFLKKYDQALLDNIVNAGSQEEALEFVAEAIKNAETATEKAAIANAAFSRSGIGMVNMLRDGKEGLDQFRETAREAGVVLDEELLRNAEKLNDEWDTFATGLKTKVMTAILETTQVVHFLSDELRALFGVVDDDDIVRLRDKAAEIREIMEGGLIAAGNRIRFFGKDGIVEYYDDDELQAELDEIEAAIQAFYEKSQNENSATPLIPLDIEIPPELDADVDSVVTPVVEGMTDAEEAALRAEEALQRFADSLIQSHDPAAVATESLQMIQDAMDAGLISAEVYGEAINATVERWKQALGVVAEGSDVLEENTDAATDQLEEMKKTADDLGFTFASAFEDAIVSGASFQDMLKGLEEDLLRIFTRKAITEPLADMFSGFVTGGMGEGGFLSGLFPSFAGGGFTGMGGRGGGLDGQGGFLAMMHPRETVIDHNRNQSAGGVTVVQNITTPNADSFRLSGRQTARDARLAYGGF